MFNAKQVEGTHVKSTFETHELENVPIHRGKRRTRNAFKRHESLIGEKQNRTCPVLLAVISLTGDYVRSNNRTY